MAMSDEGECVFCEIAAGTRGADVLYEDQHVLAFLDQRKQPAVGAHILIITRGHRCAVWDVPDDVGPPLLRAARVVATALKSRGDGVKLGCWASNGRGAGQAIRHFHLHMLTLRRPLIDVVRYFIRVEILRRRPSATQLTTLGALLRAQVQHALGEGGSRA